MSKRHVIYNSDDEVHVLKAQKAQEDVEKDLGWIMNNSRGRRWMFDLVFAKCHVDDISHVPRDTHSTAFNEGARSVGQALLQELRMNHHALLLKMLEENDERAND